MIVHVGYDKCGSTWSQMFLWPALSDNFLWLPERVLDQASRAADPGGFLRRRVRERMRGGRGRWIVSSERFVTNVNSIGAFEMAEWVWKVSPTAKIVMFYRHPYSLLWSKWRSCITRSHALISKSFEDWLESVPGSALERFRMYDMAVSYARAFGCENVKVIHTSALRSISGNYPTAVVRPTGLWDVDLVRKYIYRVFAASNKSTDNRRIVSMWRFHNKALGPMFRLMMLAKPTRLVAKAWLEVGRVCLEPLLERLVPWAPLSYHIPESFQEQHGESWALQERNLRRTWNVDGVEGMLEMVKSEV